MLLVKKKKALLLRLRDPSKVTTVIPKSKVVTYKGKEFVAVKHGVDEVRVLRNLGIQAPEPIKYHYTWPGRFKPFMAQRETAAFLSMWRRAFVLNDIGCVDADTEYLSPTGWVRIADYAGGEVAQYWPSTNKMEFVEPTEFVKKPCPTMVRIKTTFGVDQLLSPEHRVLLQSRTNPHKTEVVHAWELLARQESWLTGEPSKKSQDRIGYSEAAIPTTFRTAGGRGIGMTLRELRVQVAVIADGHFANATNRCVVRLKKARKVARLRQLLEDAKIEFVEREQNTPTAQGYTVFTFNAPRRDKVFDAKYWNAGERELHVIADEVLHWDSNVGAGRRGDRFSTFARASADFVQYAMAATGRTARVLEAHRERRGRTETEYIVQIRNGDKPLQLIGYSGGEKRAAMSVEPSTDGFKYCFMVPSTFLVLRRNGCVFCTGNTGKTLATLWGFDYLRSAGLVKKMLVVTPLSTLERTWADEIWQHFPHLTCSVVYGPADRRLKALAEDADIYIINHHGLKVKGVVEALAKRPDIDLVVVDEIAQAARNSQTDMFAALNVVVNKQHQRWAWGLTGTPIPNKPTDAWAQCRLLVPEKVPPYFKRFRDLVERQVTNFLWVPRDEAVSVVEGVMQPAIRFSRDECVDLPECVYQTREVELTPQQARAYKDMLNRLRAEIDAGEVTASNEAIKAQKLIQIACGALYGDEAEQILQVDAGPRLAVVEEVVEQCGQKVIVFVPFVSTVHLVADYLKEKGFTVECIYGEVSKGERDRIFAAFQRSDNPRVLVAQPASMSHGLTLTAASTIIWYAPITSNDVFVQANGRITRPGQKHGQLIVMLEGTEVERRYYRRLQNKQRVQGTLLDLVQEARK